MWFDCLWIVLSLFTASSSGQTFNIQGNQPYSSLGYSHVFHCNMTHGGFPGAAEVVQFLRQDEDVCKVYIKTCTQHSASNARFTCGCVNSDPMRMVMNISEVQDEDESDWSCGFRMYRIRSDKISLPLYYGPGESIKIFPSTSQSHTVNEGNSLTPLTCSASCKPDCDFKWLRAGVSFLVSNTSVLYLTNTVKTDEGYYECEASNLIGTNRSSISIFVHARAKVLQSNSQSDLTFGVGVGVGIVICAVVMVTGMGAGIICYRKWRQNSKGIRITEL